MKLLLALFVWLVAGWLCWAQGRLWCSLDMEHDCSWRGLLAGFLCMVFIGGGALLITRDML